MGRSSDISRSILGVAFCFLSLNSMWSLGETGSAKLSADEVDALRRIAAGLKKTDWDFGVDPCSGRRKWSVPNPLKGMESTVDCDCSFNNSSVCHIVTVWLKAQNLTGVLPPEFARLRHLRQLDLSRNLLNGTIPPQWATMQLHGL